MTDFALLYARLEQHPHEYTSLNAITRLIAERIGYQIVYKMRRADLRYWELQHVQKPVRPFTNKRSDLDHAWQQARLSGWIPDYMQSVDAALMLPLPEGMHRVLFEASPLDEVHHWSVMMQRQTRDAVYTDVECFSLLPAHALCLAWWAAITGEAKPE